MTRHDQRAVDAVPPGRAFASHDLLVHPRLSPWLDTESAPIWIDYVGFALALAGIGFTIWQLMRSRSALDSARLALDQARMNLVKNQLIAKLPVFTGLSGEVSRLAAAGGGRSELEPFLLQVSVESRYCAVLFEMSGETDGAIEKQLEVCATVADDARARLFTDRVSTTQDIASGTAIAVGALVPQLQARAARVLNDPRKVT